MREFIGGFSVCLDVQTALVTKLDGVIYAIKSVQKMGLTSLWLECDSTLVCVGFTLSTTVSSHAL